MSRGAWPAALAFAALLAGCAATPPSPARHAAGIPESVVQDTLETVPSGEVVSWRVEATGVRGTVTPVRTWRVSSGYCRDYSVTVSEPGGAGSTWHDSACRDGSGVWRTVPASG